MLFAQSLGWRQILWLPRVGIVVYEGVVVVVVVILGASFLKVIISAGMIISYCMIIGL